MYLMYVDESGDPGKWQGKPGGNSTTKHYILCGLVIRAQLWKFHFDNYVNLRRWLYQNYGFRIREEIKGSKLVHPRGDSRYQEIGNKSDRLSIYKKFLGDFAKKVFTGCSVISIYVDKVDRNNKPDLDNYFNLAWQRLIQRFENYLVNDCNEAPGIIVADESDEAGIRRLARKMRVFNPIPKHYGSGTMNKPLKTLIEDPIMRKSHKSYFIQAVDMITYALYRKLYVSGSLRGYNVHQYYDSLKPILNLKASTQDPCNMGIHWA